MTTVDSFEAHGTTFHFEPPIEVGERIPSSLGELAAIAVHGTAEPDYTARVMARKLNDMLEAYVPYEETAILSRIMSNAMMLRNVNHMVNTRPDTAALHHR